MGATACGCGVTGACGETNVASRSRWRPEEHSTLKLVLCCCRLASSAAALALVGNRRCEFLFQRVRPALVWFVRARTQVRHADVLELKSGRQTAARSRRPRLRSHLSMIQVRWFRWQVVRASGAAKLFVRAPVHRAWYDSRRRKTSNGLSNKAYGQIRLPKKALQRNLSLLHQ